MGALTSLAPLERLPEPPSYLMGNPTLAAQVEENHEESLSSGDEGHRFLLGLKSNPVSSLQRPQEA